MIDLDDVVSCVAAGIYGDDRMSPRERDGALASLSALVEEVKRLREDAVVARSVETKLTVEVERLRTNAAARERFLRREGDLLRAAERERDDLRKEVEHLRAPILHDEVCAACGCARFRHDEYRVDWVLQTKCWGHGYDLDNCPTRCKRFVRLTHDGRKP